MNTCHHKVNLDAVERCEHCHRELHMAERAEYRRNHFRPQRRGWVLIEDIWFREGE